MCMMYVVESGEMEMKKEGEEESEERRYLEEG